MSYVTITYAIWYDTSHDIIHQLQNTECLWFHFGKKQTSYFLFQCQLVLTLKKEVGSLHQVNCSQQVVYS